MSLFQCRKKEAMDLGRNAALIGNTDNPFDDSEFMALLCRDQTVNDALAELFRIGHYLGRMEKSDNIISIYDLEHKKFMHSIDSAYKSGYAAAFAGAPAFPTLDNSYVKVASTYSETFRLLILEGAWDDGFDEANQKQKSGYRPTNQELAEFFRILSDR